MESNSSRFVDRPNTRLQSWSVRPCEHCPTHCNVFVFVLSIIGLRRRSFRAHSRPAPEQAQQLIEILALEIARGCDAKGALDLGVKLRVAPAVLTRGREQLASLR